jgi:hypothetical protein
MQKSFIPAPIEKCNGKNCYRSKIEAEAVAREQEILNAQEELELRVYRCVDCGEWHLTKNRIQN